MCYSTGIRYFVGLCLLIAGITSAPANQTLVQDASVISIANVEGSTDLFVIWTDGGTGPCSNRTQIRFPVAHAASPEAHARAYASALTALTTRTKVIIVNYVDGTCDKASFIQLYGSM